MYQLWSELTPFVDYREHETVGVSDFINDAVRKRGDLSDFGLADFWNYTSRARQPVENSRFIDDVLKDLLGVELGVLRNEIVDGAQIGFGGIRPDHHFSISCLSSSLVVT